MGTSLLSLEQLLSEAIGDWLEFDTSTLITTGSTARIIASTLQNYDGGQDGYFKDWWAYITEGNNSGVNRQVKTYETSAGRLDLRGSAFASESSAVTCRLHRFNRRNKVKAINRAIEQLYPSLHRKIDDLTLITGNILPDNSFGWWTSNTTLKFYTAVNASLTKNDSPPFTRAERGGLSAKVTASAANGYMVLSSNNYQRLLDLMGRTIDFKCWAAPQVTNDAALVIYTEKADGTVQILTSATPSYANNFSLLELENQVINNDITKIELRFKVATNTKWVYFDDAMLCGMHLFEYLLPYDLQVGHLSQVYIQTEGYSNDIAYDIHPRYYDKEIFSIIHDGDYRYVQLRNLPVNWRRIRTIGYAPLESLSADTDTISLEGERLNLIIAQAAYNLYEMEKGIVSSEDKGRYLSELAYWRQRVIELKPTLMMMRPSHTQYTG